MRWFILFPALLLAVGIALGLYVASAADEPAPAPTPQTLKLTADDQNDYIRNVADAYAVDGNLKLAQDRLARLHDPRIVERVETLALETAAQHTGASKNLGILAVALGSQIKSLAPTVIVVTSTPPPATRTLAPQDPVFSNVRATVAPTATQTPTPIATPVSLYVVVPNENPYIILPTNTFTPSPPPPALPPATPTPTNRPFTRVPTPTETLVPTNVPPPPAPIFEPDRSQWPGTVYYEPANVAPGEGYWHLAKAVYCDAFDGSDHRKFDFGCEEGPGGGQGTSVYVMSGGSVIDVLAPDGRNVTDDITIVGDKKEPGDVCLCDYAFESSNYRVSVRGAASDGIGGGRGAKS